MDTIAGIDSGDGRLREVWRLAPNVHRAVSGEVLEVSSQTLQETDMRWT